MRSRRTTILAVLALTGVLGSLLGACRGDKPSGKDMTSPSASVTGTPTETPSPTLTPASGALIETLAFDVQLPDDPEWTPDNDGAVKGGERFTEESVASILLSSSKALTNDFERDAKNAFDIEKGQFPTSRRLDSRTLDDVTAYVFEALKPDRFRYRVGGLHEGYLWSIVFDFPNEWAIGRQVIEEILASVEFKTPVAG